MKMQRLALSVVGALVAGTFAVAGGTIRAATPAAAIELAAQTPQPFPRPTQPSEPTSAPAPSAPQPPSQTPQAPQAPSNPPPAQAPAAAPDADQAPTEAQLGVPIYPNAQFIGSYDAGKGQRFYLFGVSSSFTDMVAYYRATLKTRGEQLFETPGTHLFEIGRFRDETMAFPPSVTVKDYTWGGSPGLANPKPGAQPSHFPTVIQIVPAPVER